MTNEQKNVENIFAVSELSLLPSEYDCLKIIHPSGMYTKKSIILFAAVISLCSFLTGSGIAVSIKFYYENVLESIYYPPFVIVSVGVQAYIFGYFSSSLCGRVIFMRKIRNPRVIYWVKIFCLILVYMCTFWVWENLGLFNDSNFPEYFAHHPKARINTFSWISFFCGLMSFMAMTIQRTMRYAETPFSEENNSWLMKRRFAKAIPRLTKNMYKQLNMHMVQLHVLLQECTALGARNYNAKLFALTDYERKVCNNMIMMAYSTRRDWGNLNTLMFFFKRTIKQIVFQLDDKQFEEVVLHFSPIDEE